VKRGSSLTKFFQSDKTDGNQVLTQGEVLLSYGSRIHELQQRQSTASAAYVEATLEIGKLLREARDYAATLKLSGKDKLWKEFKDSLGYSEPTMSKYIKVAEHPVLKGKTYRSKLPPSLHSLYELSKLDAPTLKEHISSGQINPTVGRSEVAAVLGKKSEKPQLVSSVQTEIFVITVPKKDWQSKFLSVEDAMKEFCKEHALGLKISKTASEFLNQRNNDETLYDKKIRLHVLRSAKKFCKEQAISMVNTKFKERYPLLVQKSLGFKAKYKKLKYGEDEIECGECTDTDEVKAIYLSFGLDGEEFWNEQYGEWFTDAMTQVKRPKSLEFEAEITSHGLEQVVVSRPKPKKRNFTGVKV